MLASKIIVPGVPDWAVHRPRVSRLSPTACWALSPGLLAVARRWPWRCGRRRSKVDHVRFSAALFRPR